MRCRLPLAFVLLLAGTTAHGRPAHKKAVADYFGPALAPRLNDCRLCHVAAKPTDEEHEHNPFGKRLAAIREELKRARKKTDIISRLVAIADEDSDGDGVANLLELLSGHFPGEGADKPTAAELTDARRKLTEFRRSKTGSAWAPFEPVRRPEVPEVRNTGWVRNPIDAFLGAEHEKHGLTPRPVAPRHVLLRRVYLDLIGLPPSRSELHAFLADQTPDAFERAVDRLLASPQYGERWGRHWMDVWRYSDWAGFGAEVRESHPHIWRWRDWIVESLNADKGYDRMIREMLAGDEIAPCDPDTLRATGFLVRQWYVFNRNVWLDNAVEHTAKAFLGVTLSCARCHDHKYDPIGQEDYYRFRAFFEPYHVRTDRVPGQPDLAKDGVPRVYDAFLDAKTYLFVRGDEAHPDKSKELAPAVPAALGGPPLQIEPVALPLLAYRPDKRDYMIRDLLADSAQNVLRVQQALTAARQKAARAVAGGLLPQPLGVAAGLATARQAWDEVALLEADEPLAAARHEALVAAVRAEQIEDSGKKDTSEWKRSALEACALQRKVAVLEARRQLLALRQAQAAVQAKAKVEAARKVQEAEQAVAKAEADTKQPPSTAYAPRPARYPQAAVAYGQTRNDPYPPTSSGRRLALARWIADRQNPLTARVAMNHLWLRHFGKPLVPTVFDFGGNGQPPSHPALLDWLAAEFMDRGWGMKAMHRLIVTSSAYRMDSGSDPACAAADPDNQHLWRMNSRRMEAEAVRDSVLHVAGQLDPVLGGPDLDHQLGLTSRRRSLYFRHANEKEMEFLYLFDSASVTECYRRTESVIPQQALALANSTLAQAMARLLARRLGESDDVKFVRLAFEEVLGRPPSASELSECLKFLHEQARRLADRAKLSAFSAGPPSTVSPSTDPKLRAREDLVQVLMNHNEFVTIR